MYSRLPSPYNPNKQFSTDQQFRNPAGTNPLPRPSDMPSSCWFGNRQVLNNWRGEPVEDNEMMWASPIFDLQPQLRGLNGQSTTNMGSPLNNRQNRGLNAIPLWGGGALHLQISNLQGTNSQLTDLKLIVTEEAHISDSGQLAQVLPAADITQQINTTTNSVILSFQPLGDGSKVRFWRVMLKFYRNDNVSPVLPLPTFYIDAGYY
jgi:hypothetical protein